MSYLDLIGKAIAKAAAEQGYDYEICAGDGSYLFRTFHKGTVLTLTPREFMILLGLETRDAPAA